MLSELGGGLQVLLIRRKHAPFEGCWALPGGFVDENEPLEDCAARELFEETGLRGVELRQFRAFGNPGRDPRGWTVTIAFVGRADATSHPIEAADDAADARWLPVDSLPELAYDHKEIIACALQYA